MNEEKAAANHQEQAGKCVASLHHNVLQEARTNAAFWSSYAQHKNGSNQQNNATHELNKKHDSLPQGYLGPVFHSSGN
jgi:hypothetical protein